MHTAPEPLFRRSAPPPAPSHAFRADIQGLRAIAVLLVLIVHAGFTWLPNGYVGVDVFFVISGYLITGLLLKERQESGRVALAAFYARRARRLLPAACTVIVVTVIGSLLLLPELRWGDLRGDALASTFYVQNWRLAEQSVDYMADPTPGPLQHFWSLAVEEQFYLVWPCLFMLLTPRGSYSRGRMARTLGIGVGVVFAASLLWSIQLTADEPKPAYFHTAARAFEFALGAAAAVYVHRSRRRPLPASARRLAGWTGLALVLGSALWLPDWGGFPGYLALAPTLGAALVLIAGADAATGPARLLSSTPLVRLGDLSYSVYLWHWPMLILAEARWGPLSLAVSAAIVAAAVLPAALTFHFVENPPRRSHRFAAVGPGLGLGAACMAVAAAAAVVIGVMAPDQGTVDAAAQTELDRIDAMLTTTTAAPTGPAGTTPDSAATEPGTTPGLGALSVDEPEEQAGYRQAPVVEQIVNDPLTVDEERPPCVTRLADSSLTDCLLGALDGSQELVLIGDSKAAQWVPAFDTVTAARGWRLRVLSKAACAFTGLESLAHEENEFPACVEWNRNVMGFLLDVRPDVVVVTGREQPTWQDGTPVPGASSRPALTDDLVARFGELTAAGIRVIVLLDTPRPTVDVPECVVANRVDLTACTFPRQDALPEGGGALGAAAATLGLPVVDVNAAICPDVLCPVVIGEVMVYADSSHLAATYVRTLAPVMAAALDAVGAFDTA